MARTKPLNSKSNIKQSTSGDMPLNPVSYVTRRDRQTSTLGQTVINIPSFAVDMNNKDAFLLIINGRVMDEGASNDYTFTNIQSNNTSSQVTLTQSLPAGLPIVTILAGVVVQQEPNVNSLQAQINNLGGSAPGLVNLIALDSAYAITKQQNSDAEKGIGDWISYANAANIAPTDMSSGVANTTITRDTAGTINGVASFLMTVNTGATRQGEGVACTAYIPPAYRGRTLTFSFPFTLTGTVVDGDFSLYAYDVTNAQVITPYQANKILGASGQALCTFPVASNCTQIKVGIHVARASNNGAVAIRFDDVKLSPDVPALGMAGSDWTAYAPTMVGFGTPSSVKFYYRRNGDSVDIKGTFVTGTPTATTIQISMPPNLAIDFTKVSNAGGQAVGQLARNAAASPYFVTLSSTDTANLYVSVSSSLSNASGTAFGSGEFETLTAYSIPVAGYSSNISIGMSSTYRISSYLANGTRVTGTAPTALGQYRSYIRSASSSLSGTDNAPTNAPSASNGMILYSAAYNAAGTSGNPQRYEIFVGKNKNVAFKWYSGTGFSGYVDTSPMASSATAVSGVRTSYDPTTGIAFVDTLWTNNAGDSSHDIGLVNPSGTGAGSYPLSAYFDIIVSENALAVGIAAPRSYVIGDTPVGHGSTGTKIRTWTAANMKTTGTAITYTSDSVNGDKFTINEDGIYCLQVQDRCTTGSGALGFSLNSANLTTALFSLSTSERILGNQASTSLMGTLSVTRFLPAGSVVRQHDDGNLTETTNLGQIIITKVSN